MEEKFVTDVMAALGQSTRLQILKVVAPFSHGTKAVGVTAGQIAKELDVAPATLSFHLKDMNYKGLLQQTRDGRMVYYRADIDTLLKALDYLVTEVCEA